MGARHIVSTGDQLLSRKVLTRLLKSGAGFWEGAEIPATEFTNQFSNLDQSLLPACVQSLVSAGLVRIHEGGIGLTRAGYEQGQRALEEASSSAVTRPPPGPSELAPPEFPFEVRNPAGTPWQFAPGFLDDMRAPARDRRLARALATKMEAALLSPGLYGKRLRGSLRGQFEAYVANNYRLRWTLEGECIRFILFKSKEDPAVSPLGAR